jgi:hypothetical protein
MEAGLLKMVVARERIGDPALAHDDERDAVGDDQSLSALSRKSPRPPFKSEVEVATTSMFGAIQRCDRYAATAPR